MTRVATTGGRALQYRIVGALALAIAIIALFVNVHVVAATFLVAYAAAVSVILGILATIMIAHLTTATWFGPLRWRALRALDALPVLAVLGVLILLAIPSLYPWVSAAPPSGVSRYLNVPFFIVRFIVCWAIWIGLAHALRSTMRMEGEGDIARATKRYRRISALGLILLGLTMTIAAFDWLMSLSPEWYSTIYGVYWFAGGLVGALSLLAVLASTGSGAGGTDTVHAIAKLLLTFILFWVYIGFSQYIVIWSGGIPREVTWYVPRTHGGWGGLAALLLFGNFAFPFLILLIEPLKRSRSVVAAVGVLLLALHYLDTFWLVMPGLVSITWWTIIVAAAALVVVAWITIAGPSLRRPRVWRNATRLPEGAS